MKPPLTDRSLPLPAISTMYVEGVSRHPTEIREPEKLPLKYSDTMDRLNFLSERNYIHHYPYCLYSAGHAELDPQKARKKESAIFNRDKDKVFLMTDSGGFQVKDNVGKFKGCNWSDKSDVNKRRLEILRWIEAVDPDASMNLDIPSATAMKVSKNRYFNDFRQCIDWTVDNWNYWEANQEKEINWINCLHGKGIDEAKDWYKAVKDYPKTKKGRLAGWAIAGFIGRSLHDTLYMLLKLREDGKLDGVDYIHFLGKFQAHISIYLKALQNIIRTTHPNIIVSFDAASPFILASKRQVIVGAGPNAKFDTFRLYPQKTAKMPMGTGVEWFDSIDQFRLSPYIKGLTFGDIRGPVYRKLDRLSYCILMAHNVYAALKGLEEAENHVRWIWRGVKQYHRYPELFEAIKITHDVWSSENGLGELDRAKPHLKNIFASNDKYEERA